MIVHKLQAFTHKIPHAEEIYVSVWILGSTYVAVFSLSCKLYCLVSTFALYYADSPERIQSEVVTNLDFPFYPFTLF